jgi:hypothetical protein
MGSNIFVGHRPEITKQNSNRIHLVVNTEHHLSKTNHTEKIVGLAVFI